MALYRVVGLRRCRAVPPGFMRGVRWSTEDTLADTLATLPPESKVAMLDILRDIDTIDDLHARKQAVE